MELYSRYSFVHRGFRGEYFFLGILLVRVSARGGDHRGARRISYDAIGELRDKNEIRIVLDVFMVSGRSKFPSETLSHSSIEMLARYTRLAS